MCVDICLQKKNFFKKGIRHDVVFHEIPRQKFLDLKLNYEEFVFHEVSRPKFYDLKVKCDDEVFHEVPRQKFLDL